MLLDRAIVEALHDVFGESVKAFMLRVRDALVSRGFSEEEANAVVNAYLSYSGQRVVEMSDILGREEKFVDGFAVVRVSIIEVLTDLLGDEARKHFVKRASEKIREYFRGDLDEVVEAINADVSGRPVKGYRLSGDTIEIELSKGEDFIAELLARVALGEAKLVEKVGGKYVFKRARFLRYS